MAAHLNLKAHGGDAKDAFAHSLRPEMDTHPAVNDVRAKQHEATFSKPINQKHALSIKRALQGNQESGRLWEIHINTILKSPELDFKMTTTHDRTICMTTFNGEPVHLICQVDDFELAFTNEVTADKMCNIMGKKLQLPNEDKPPLQRWD